MIKDVLIYFGIPVLLIFVITLFIFGIEEKNKYNMDLSREEIRFQGEQARETGLPVFVNPYENEKGQIWLDGWMEGVNND
jgi:hypothetical protein